MISPSLVLQLMEYAIDLDEDTRFRDEKVNAMVPKLKLAMERQGQFGLEDAG